jgi:serine/threonine-protein kinase haspin
MRMFTNIPQSNIKMARKYGKKRPVASAAAAAIFGAADSTITATIPPSPSRPALAEITNLLERTTLQVDCVDLKGKVNQTGIKDERDDITTLLERTTIRDDAAESITVLEKTILKDDTLDEIVVSIDKISISPSLADEAASPVPLPTLKPALATSLAPLLDAYEIDRGYPLATKKWDDVLAPGSTLEKIAEASYAEVFRITNPIGSSILKLLRLKVPTDPTSKKSDTAIKVDTVVSEMRLMNALTEIPGFVKFKDAHIVEGKPPAAFVEAYEAHIESAEESYFPHPNYISEAAVFLAIELGDAGCVLEQCKISNIHQMWDIFLGVVIALARAEIEYEFEVRTFHLLHK